MKVILDLNPDECLALIQVLERDILFRDVTSRVIDDIDRHRRDWANDVRNLGYLRAEDTDWHQRMKKMADKSEVREAVANYIASEGCSCCQSIDKHELAKTELADLLDVPKYDDGSGHDFYQYRSNKE